MYKDKDKQREANRLAQAKFKAKGITKGITSEGITDKVLPEGYIGAVPYTPPILEPDLKQYKAEFKERHGLKRGKDIKTFADLPPDVQETIDMMSTTDGKIDRVVKDRRTAIAIRYQHVLDSSQRDKVLPLLRKYAYNGQA